jgi:hypothetical protein
MVNSVSGSFEPVVYNIKANCGNQQDPGPDPVEPDPVKSKDHYYKAALLR